MVKEYLLYCPSSLEMGGFNLKIRLELLIPPRRVIVHPNLLTNLYFQVCHNEINLPWAINSMVIMFKVYYRLLITYPLMVYKDIDS